MISPEERIQVIYKYKKIKKNRDTAEAALGIVAWEQDSQSGLHYTWKTYRGQSQAGHWLVSYIYNTNRSLNCKGRGISHTHPIKVS